MAHPGNLCIDSFLIRRNFDIPALLSSDFRATAGACYKDTFKGATLSAAQAKFDARMANGGPVLPSPRDLRPLCPVGPPPLNPPPEDEDVYEVVSQFEAGCKHTFIHFDLCKAPALDPRPKSAPASSRFPRHPSDIRLENENASSVPRDEPYAHMAWSWMGEPPISPTLQPHPSAPLTHPFMPTLTLRATPVRTHNSQDDMTSARSEMTADAYQVSLEQSLPTSPDDVRYHVTLPVQTSHPQRMPPFFQPGDDRFHKSLKHGRQFACDSCAEVFGWQSEYGVPFDGDWTQPAPTNKKGQGYANMLALWTAGLHDCTWICTNCSFDQDANADDIAKFREAISAPYLKQRQGRTKLWQQWIGGASPKPVSATRYQ